MIGVLLLLLGAIVWLVVAEMQDRQWRAEHDGLTLVLTTPSGAIDFTVSRWVSVAIPSESFTWPKGNSFANIPEEEHHP